MNTLKTKTETKLKWHSLEQVVRASSKSAVFKQAYDEELAQLRLAKKLRELRSTKRLTQKMVADRVGMPQSVIARIESGTRWPRSSVRESNSSNKQKTPLRHEAAFSFPPPPPPPNYRTNPVIRPPQHRGCFYLSKRQKTPQVGSFLLE